MAIEALYPSRRQSHWANPLFMRQRLRKLGRTALVASALAVTAVGAWGFVDYAQPQNASVTQQNTTVPDSIDTDVPPQAKPLPVRIIPLFSTSQADRWNSSAG
jgi:hypothetical protein